MKYVAAVDTFIRVGDRNVRLEPGKEYEFSGDEMKRIPTGILLTKEGTIPAAVEAAIDASVKANEPALKYLGDKKKKKEMV